MNKPNVHNWSMDKLCQLKIAKVIQYTHKKDKSQKNSSLQRNKRHKEMKITTIKTCYLWWYGDRIKKGHKRP
jgi:hypothetical protein